MILTLKRALSMPLLAAALAFGEPLPDREESPELAVAPALPASEEIAFKSILLPSWGAYASGNNRLATVFALVDAGLLRGAYETSRLYGDQAEVFSLIGLALITSRVVAVIANQSQVNGNERMGHLPVQSTPRPHRIGISLSAGQYTGTSGYGLSLDLGKLRLSARRGGYGSTLDYKLRDDLGGDRLHRLTFAESYALGFEGVWRINSLMRVQPGMQLLMGEAIRETFQLAENGWGNSRRLAHESDTWIQAIPTFTSAFDAFDPLALSTGIGYEIFRPGPDRDFYRSMAAPEAQDKDAAPGRLRFHIELEYRFL